MTDEGKAEKYVSPERWGDKYYVNQCGDWSNEDMKQAYLDGLAEGRKEGYEQGKNNERELQCGKKNYEKDIARLEKENEQLKAQIEKMKLDQKTAFDKGIKHLAKKLKEYDRINGASTDYFEHTVNKVLKWELGRK